MVDHPTVSNSKKQSTETPLPRSIHPGPLAYFTDIQSELHQEQVLFRGNSIDNKVIFKDSTKQTMQADGVLQWGYDR